MNRVGQLKWDAGIPGRGTSMSKGAVWAGWSTASAPTGDNKGTPGSHQSHRPTHSLLENDGGHWIPREGLEAPSRR